jgi:hypothetical protein
MRKSWPILLVFVLVFSSCLKRNQYSDLPIIKYKSIWRVDNSLVIKFSFTDGNGDIGLKDEEVYFPFGPCDKYFKNLIIDPYRREGGKFVIARKIVPSDCGPDSITTWDTVGYDQRIKYIFVEGKDKNLEGDIEVTLNEVLDEFPNDTIKFKLTLYDRALNKSNEIESETVVTF